MVIVTNGLTYAILVGKVVTSEALNMHRQVVSCRSITWLFLTKLVGSMDATHS